MESNYIRLPLERQPASREEYLALWDKTGPLELRMVEKIGRCKHELHDSFQYQTPYKRPENVCAALLHVVDLYAWRAALGFPSWEQDDPTVYRIHCPSKKGTVWELRKINTAPATA